MDEALKERRLIGRIVIQLGAALTAFHLLAVMSRWYHRFPWIDTPQHFFGGVLAGLIFYWLAYRFRDAFNLNRNSLFTLLFVLSWTALLGVLFEFTEFIYDLIIFDYLEWSTLRVQLGLADTIGDLFFNLLGGLSLAIIMRLRYDRRKRQL